MEAGVADVTVADGSPAGRFSFTAKGAQHNFSHIGADHRPGPVTCSGLSHGIQVTSEPGHNFTITWNGKPVSAHPGDTVAQALFRAGHRETGCSRKRHRPLGWSGTFVLGVLAEVDGNPNTRIDQYAATPGLRVTRQNAWPSPRFDLLKLLRLVPARLTRSGFEHTMLFPGGTLRFALWERLLAFLAGGGRLRAEPTGPAVVPGRRIACDVCVIGAGPAGIAVANLASTSGKEAVLVSRGSQPARFATAMGNGSEMPDPDVTFLAGTEACAIYRGGRLVVASPISGGPAIVIECRELVLATGQRSVPPLVRGNSLPGVIDAQAALSLALRDPRAFGATLVTGTEGRHLLADRLRKLGVDVVDVQEASALRAILGTSQVRGADTGQHIACRTIVHAGPWRTDPNLMFQATSEGELRLLARAPGANVRVAGAAGRPDEDIAWISDFSGAAEICPCMDVTAAEIAGLVQSGVTHIEEIKRQTSCGMGPCQGFPCWDMMQAVVSAGMGDAAVADRPSHRGPRRAISVAQAAGLAGLVDPLQ